MQINALSRHRVHNNGDLKLGVRVDEHIHDLVSLLLVQFRVNGGRFNMRITADLLNEPGSQGSSLSH